MNEARGAYVSVFGVPLEGISASLQCQPKAEIPPGRSSRGQHAINCAFALLSSMKPSATIVLYRLELKHLKLMAQSTVLLAKPQRSSSVMNDISCAEVRSWSGLCGPPEGSVPRVVREILGVLTLIGSPRDAKGATTSQALSLGLKSIWTHYERCSMRAIRQVQGRVAVFAHSRFERATR
jgi:hypothetical protein